MDTVLKNRQYLSEIVLITDNIRTGVITQCHKPFVFDNHILPYDRTIDANINSVIIVVNIYRIPPDSAVFCLGDILIFIHIIRPLIFPCR